MNKWQGSICLAVGRQDGGDETRDLPSLLMLNGILMNHIHTRRDAGISFWLSGGARVVFPQGQSELKKTESANKKWNTTVCLSCVAINLKCYRPLMESIKTVCVLEFLCMRGLTMHLSNWVQVKLLQTQLCMHVFAFWHGIIGNAGHELSLWSLDGLTTFIKWQRELLWKTSVATEPTNV